jgi:hypothetical protein
MSRLENASGSASVTELRGDERGVWRVTTAKSHYIFDLDEMTVTRHPGKEASTGINDVTRPIDVLVVCQVGRNGFWTMKPEDDMAALLEDYWQSSTEIKSIERM